MSELHKELLEAWLRLKKVQGSIYGRVSRGVPFERDARGGSNLGGRPGVCPLPHLTVSLERKVGTREKGGVKSTRQS